LIGYWLPLESSASPSHLLLVSISGLFDLWKNNFFVGKPSIVEERVGVRGLLHVPMHVVMISYLNHACGRRVPSRSLCNHSGSNLLLLDCLRCLSSISVIVSRSPIFVISCGGAILPRCSVRGWKTTYGSRTSMTTRLATRLRQPLWLPRNLLADRQTRPIRRPQCLRRRRLWIDPRSAPLPKCIMRHLVLLHRCRSWFAHQASPIAHRQPRIAHRHMPLRRDTGLIRMTWFVPTSMLLLPNRPSIRSSTTKTIGDRIGSPFSRTCVGGSGTTVSLTCGRCFKQEALPPQGPSSV